jgi:hypothetical protein
MSESEFHHLPSVRSDRLPVRPRWCVSLSLDSPYATEEAPIVAQRARQLHPGPQRHLPEVHDVRQHERVFVMVFSLAKSRRAGLGPSNPIELFQMPSVLYEALIWGDYARNIY